MPNTPQVTLPRPSHRLSSRFLPIALAAAVACAVEIRQFHHDTPPTIEAQLQGDSDEALGGLSRQLATLLAAQQLPFLLKAAQDPNPGLRYAAVDALAARKDEAAAVAVEQAFRDSASPVRQRAVEALPDTSPSRGHPLLQVALTDEDVWIREAAATQIVSRLNHKPTKIDARFVPTLIAALNDTSPVVSSSAVSALCKLTGNPWRVRNTDTAAHKAAVRALWRHWWQQAQSTWPTAPTVAAPLRPTRTDPAPNFDIADVQGQHLTNATQRGRITLLNFWGTWCPPCQKEIPDLIQVDQLYRNRGVDVIGIALSETSADSLTAWCRSHHVEYRQALAPPAVQEAFGHIEEVPISVLIDAQGRIRYRWEGERDLPTFRAAIDRLLHESQQPE